MMKKLALAGSCLLFLLTACKQNSRPKFQIHQHPMIVGKATPIQLENPTTLVILSDYVVDHELDSITNTAGLEQVIKKDTLTLTGIPKQPLAILQLWKDGIAEGVLLRRSNKETIELTFKGKAHSVKAKGEFNAWNPENTILKKTGDSWITQLNLNKGVYQYLLVVDGVEMLDPTNPDSVDNGIGGYNSVIDLPRPLSHELPNISADSYINNNLTFSTSIPVDGIVAFLDNYLIPQDFIKSEENQIILTLPEEMPVDRSHVRLWGYNTKGISNDVLVPLHNGKVLADVDDLNKEDYEAMVMYFLMVDRFNNGNKENDRPLNQREVHPKADYHGGDLAGVQKKIEDGYFDSLGINTIWLSPITQNPEGAYGQYPTPKTSFSAYHGYWPISSTQVDYRFGTSDEMHRLVNTAHKNNMNILLDYVANHVHELHPIYQEHKDWATELYLPDGTLNTERWDDHRLTTWFDTFMPTLDLSRKEIVDPMTDSALFWLQHYNIDGFRHDATKHIPLIFWRTLTSKIKKQALDRPDKKIFQIGETYGSRELISSYINTGMLDAQFDFNLYDDAVSTFAQDHISFGRLTNSLRESLAYYGDHNLMGYITGNQDRARFISYADGSLQFDEDAKLAGWTRKINVQDTTAYRKLSSLTAFMMTIPGVPVIYYGDEFGSPGGGDPDNRRMMKFNELSVQEKATRERAEKLINLRRSNLALIYGDLQIIEETDDLLVIKRSYFNDHVVSAFNKSPQTQSIDLSAEKGVNHFYGTFKGNQLMLPAYSFDIITY